jgi:hypothetical protein
MGGRYSSVSNSPTNANEDKSAKKRMPTKTFFGERANSKGSSKGKNNNSAYVLDLPEGMNDLGQNFLED